MNVNIATRLAVIALGFGACLVPSTASAQITLPFSTTYDCPEQSQDTPGWVTCDGQSKGGDWQTQNSSAEQITAAANYPGGGGGRGHRHWFGQSHATTNNSGGVSYSFTQQVQEVYVRWYVRWQAGTKLGGDTQPIARNHKVIYFAGGNCGYPSGCYWDIGGDHFAFVVNGRSKFFGAGWDGMFGGSYNAPSDGRWIMMEIHMKNETGGLNNGVAQWWVDGKLVVDQHDIDFAGSTGFWGFILPSNHQFTTVQGDCCDMFEDFDDVAIRTTGPIGPVAGGGSSSSGSAPTAPVNLRIVP
jgi:hypothetical protein